jgi:hypothetical protein
MSKNIEAIYSIYRFGIRIVVFNLNIWNEISKTNNCNLPFVVGRFYTYKNEWKEEISCGFEVLGQFVDLQDAENFYTEKSNYLRI